MPTYRNGRVPDHLLVTFASGWLPAEGTWKHQLPPATYRKHLALVALAKRNTGRTLKISEGWGAYRPYAIQVYAKKVHGIWAATPGTSSHGMFWEGRQCAAIDYGNWGHVYAWNRDAFYRDVRAVGLVPGLISPGRGYPDEPWHVVDRDPWAAVPSGGVSVPGVSNPKPVPVVDDFEEDDIMGYYFRDASTANRGYRFFNEARGKSRLVTTAEWESRKAVAETKGGEPLPHLVPVSKSWYDKIVALGTY